MRSDNTLTDTIMLRAADHFIYAAGAALALVLAYGYKFL
jgi:hypothetical protein